MRRCYTHWPLCISTRRVGLHLFELATRRCIDAMLISDDYTMDIQIPFLALIQLKYSQPLTLFGHYILKHIGFLVFRVEKKRIR